jgi:hypothetical protein
MAGMLISDPPTAAALRQLQVMLVGGEALPVEVANELRRLVPGKLLNMYGPTETTVWSTVSEIHPGDASVSIGTPIANTSIYILGPNQHRLPPGFVGELWIGGDGVTRGYFNRPELTIERFLPDPFAVDASARMYRTGDLARFRHDGTIEFLGRVDQQVKVRGFRIEPGEIESVVRTVENVGEAVVIAREDEPGDQRLVCYFVASGGGAPSERALRDAVARRLPAHMVPTNFVEMDALPLTPNKKIDRNALPRPGIAIATVVPVVPESGDVGRRTVGSESKVASSEAIRLVQDIWIDVLKTPSVERDRTFFDCGGNSLLLLQVHRRLAEHHATLRITDLFKHPTINTLAAHLSSNQSSTSGLDDASRRASARRLASGRRPVTV